jgi:hypothetical protein
VGGEIAALVLALALAAPLATEAQQAIRVSTVCPLFGSSAPSPSSTLYVEMLRLGLHELG